MAGNSGSVPFDAQHAGEPPQQRRVGLDAPPDRNRLLARKALGDLFDELRGQFEWVLVDSPPLASVTHALLLARHADLSILVVQHNKVDKKLVKRSVAALRKVTPTLLGAVLNVVDVRARSYQYYYYPQKDAAAETKPPPAAADVAAGTTARTGA